jgi:predicted DNA-binding protein with PD1-like motif
MSIVIPLLTGHNLTIACAGINPSGATMETIRSLRQPGPRHPSRIDIFRGDPHALQFALKPGVTLNEAITTPLVGAGFQSGTVTFMGTGLNPFQYVMPGPADDSSHVAYFTAPRAPSGTTRIELANATIGWAGGKPFIHCHAAWIEPDGRRRGGHILPHETIVAESGEATAWGFHSPRIEATPDPETNFTLFQPSGVADGVGRGVVARIKPNEDIIVSLETIARTCGIRNALVRGSLGSLIGAHFTDGRNVEDHATEVLVREGHIRDGKAALELLVVDMQGQVHAGWLRRGENLVCITFDVVLESCDA